MPIRKETGVDISYYGIAEDKMFSEKECEEKSSLERITTYLHEEFRRRRYTSFSMENVHDKTYLLNLLGRELGLYCVGEKPKLDPQWQQYFRFYERKNQTTSFR